MVADLLDELAARSKHTCIQLRNAYPKSTQRRVPQILADLFDGATPFEAAVLVQIILKDLRPLLYPPATLNTTSSLLDFKSNAVEQLVLHEAMRVWDPSRRMEEAYKTRSSFEAAGDTFEYNVTEVQPFIGVFIKVQPCRCGDEITLNMGATDPKISQGTIYLSRPLPL
jgi:DNA ligase-4